jgi:glycine cleavage system aminomethyltransferase T
MLAHVRMAPVVRARIEELDLGRRFDAVLLASNLFSTEPTTRRAFLRTCRRHADVVIVETLPIGWTPRTDESQIGEVTSRTRVDRIEDGVAHGAVEYEGRGKSWTHEFAMRIFANQTELEAALAKEKFRFDRWLDRRRGWFVATAVRARS